MAVKTAKEKKRLKTEEQLRQGLNEFVVFSNDLDGVDVRVYLYLSALLNFETPVHVPQIQMATLMGRQQTHISRSLRKLVSVGVLKSGPNGTRASEWMLNPDYDA